MARGATAAEAVEIVIRTAAHREYRQVLAVDAHGVSAIHSGSKALGLWAARREKDVACGGNLLANENVPSVMVDSFLASPGDLGDRLITALRAAVKAGGEVGPVRSAGLKLVRDVSWPVADLRCDWSEDCPVEQLAHLWDIYKPQLESYVTRAINPLNAPSFGVAGDR
jgi:uncharacterized Ntn-hydrolase superfamily protein